MSEQLATLESHVREQEHVRMQMGKEKVLEELQSASSQLQEMEQKISDVCDQLEGRLHNPDKKCQNTEKKNASTYFL